MRFKLLRRNMNAKHLMRFQSETSVFNILRLSVDGACCKRIFSERFDTGSTFLSSVTFSPNLLSFLFLFRGCYWSGVQGLGLRTKDSDPPWSAQEHHQSAGSLHAGKATDGDHGICPSWQLAIFSSNKEGHLRTRLDQDNQWSRERVHLSWSGDDRLSVSRGMAFRLASKKVSNKFQVAC